MFNRIEADAACKHAIVKVQDAQGRVVKKKLKTIARPEKYLIFQGFFEVRNRFRKVRNNFRGVRNKLRTTFWVLRATFREMLVYLF